jgi:hypothetical protein
MNANNPTRSDLAALIQAEWQTGLAINEPAYRLKEANRANLESRGAKYMEVVYARNAHTAAVNAYYAARAARYAAECALNASAAL